jgi:tRNA dimethylallyltransferase
MSIFQPKVIIILGPTASGKSDLAVKIASKFNGEIISADSRQVYKGLNIGSGKVPRDKNPKSKILNPKKIQNSKSQTQKQLYFYKGIRHHLLDVASPKKTFTVSQYQKLGKKAIKNIIKQGKIPIICGGTGLYINSLIYDYQFPQVPPQPKLRAKLEKLSTEKLFKKLQKLDPRRAKNIDKNNRRRLIRALEIIIFTGKPVPLLNDTRVNPQKSAAAFTILKIGIKKSPEELKRLIKKRLMTRLQQGMIKEVKNLHYKQGLSWKRLDDLGLEYRYVSRYLRGLISKPHSRASSLRDKNEMMEVLEKEIYQYAKRQMTWFKRDPEIIWVENPKNVYTLARKFLYQK